MLQFWTMATSYTIGDVDDLRGICLLFDRDRKMCGEGWVNSVEESTLFERPGPIEVILLSKPNVLPGKLTRCATHITQIVLKHLGSGDITILFS
jgi:hypothetical protein